MAPLLTAVSLLLLLCFASFPGRGQRVGGEVCRGAHCHHPAPAAAQDWSSSGSSSSRGRQIFYPGQHQQQQQQVDARTSHRHAQQHNPQRAAGFTYAAGAEGGARRTNPRTVTAEVYHPDCAGGRCHGGGGGGGGGVSSSGRTHHAAQPECKGVECKLPLGVTRLQKAAHAGRASPPSPVRVVADRAAQFLGDLADSSGASSSLGIQLTCDMKPGGSA